jgi:hypothetical protein
LRTSLAMIEQDGPVAASGCSGVEHLANRPVKGLYEHEGPPFRSERAQIAAGEAHR